jgi:hypothetical protein
MNRNFINFPTTEPYSNFFPFSKKGRYKNPHYLVENWAQKKELYNQNRRKKYLHLGIGSGRLGDRHRLDSKTRHWVNFFLSEGYNLVSPEQLTKSISGGRRTFLALAINNNKNLFFLKEGRKYYQEQQKDFLLAYLVQREKKELERILQEQPRRFRKKWRELKLKVEILSQWDHPSKLVPGYLEAGRPRPIGQVKGWNQPTYWESKNRSLASLAFIYEVILGKVETPLLDLDPNKKDKLGNYKIKQEWLRKDLSVGGKKWKYLINKYQLPYYWTTATPGNSLLPLPFWFIGDTKKAKVWHRNTHTPVADLLSKDSLVALPVGAEPNRQLVITQWGWKLVKKFGTESILQKKLLTGDAQEQIEQMLQSVFLTLGKSKRKVRSNYRTVSTQTRQQPKKSKETNLVKILDKCETYLPDIWKISYQPANREEKFCLLNVYQRPGVLEELEIGREMDLVLVNGHMHGFLNRIG